VVRHDQVRVGGDEQPVAGHAPLGQPIDLGQQHLRVDHDTVADDRRAARGQHPGRHQVQGKLLAVGRDDRVAGVVAALVSHDEVDPLAEQVGHLALALVAPLGTDEHNPWHPCLASRGNRWATLTGTHPGMSG
jgi:hypothetical protein